MCVGVHSGSALWSFVNGEKVCEYLQVSKEVRQTSLNRNVKLCVWLISVHRVYYVSKITWRVSLCLSPAHQSLCNHWRFFGKLNKTFISQTACLYSKHLHFSLKSLLFCGVALQPDTVHFTMWLMLLGPGCYHVSVLSLYMFTIFQGSINSIWLIYSLFSRYFSNQLRDVFTEEDFELYRYIFNHSWSCQFCSYCTLVVTVAHSQINYRKIESWLKDVKK